MQRYLNLIEPHLLLLPSRTASSHLGRDYVDCVSLLDIPLIPVCSVLFCSLAVLDPGVGHAVDVHCSLSIYLCPLSF